MNRSIVALMALLLAVAILPAAGVERETIISREIHFELDKANLSSEAKDVLNEVASYLKDNPGVTATVIGHTCDLATNPYNEKLAQRRAKAAMRYIVSRGIDARRLNVGARGEEQPKYDNNDEAQKPLNRRVEIQLKIMQVIPPPVVTISADPVTVTRGQATNLSWTSLNATRVEVSPGVGTVATNGGQRVSPTIGTTYTAKAIGEGGEATASTHVNVVDPPAPSGILRTTKVSVVDATGNFLIDLGASNFSVREDGVNREIVSVEYVAEGDVASIALVLDKSASLGAAIRDLKNAAVTFVKSKKAEDQVLAMAFSSDVVVLREFEKDQNALEVAIRRLSSAGNTRLYDALYAAAEKMANVGAPRIAVLMTDGVDEGAFGSRGSIHTFEEALAKAKENGLNVYTIGLGSKLDKSILERIANETKGQAYFTTDPTELTAIYAKLSQGLLRGSYKIVYKSTADASGRASVTSRTGRVVGGN